LAGRGTGVLAGGVDRGGLAHLRGAATDAAGRIACVQMDLDAPGIRAASIDGMIVVSFLDRRLFAEAARWLRPGGILLWDTFLLEQREIGHPRAPAFRLGGGEPGRGVGEAFEVLAPREGLVEEPTGAAYRSGIVARRRA